jgi:hypothetical protein
MVVRMPTQADMVLWAVHQLRGELGRDVITLTDIESRCHFPALCNLEELASRGDVEVRHVGPRCDAYVITGKGLARLRFQGFFAEWDDGVADPG